MTTKDICLDYETARKELKGNPEQKVDELENKESEEYLERKVDELEIKEGKVYYNGKLIHDFDGKIKSWGVYGVLESKLLSSDKHEFAMRNLGDYRDTIEALPRSCWYIKRKRDRDSKELKKNLFPEPERMNISALYLFFVVDNGKNETLYKATSTDGKEFSFEEVINGDIMEIKIKQGKSGKYLEVDYIDNDRYRKDIIPLKNTLKERESPLERLSKKQN